MSSFHVVELPGCTPEPLMSYLKALGVLRLVSEQADPQALGYWSQDRFVLESRLSRDELVDFFLDKYSPTPILGPWAGGSGFFGKDNRKAVQSLEKSSSDRLADYRKAIGKVQDILKAEGLDEKPENKDAKAKLLRRYRREMPDAFVSWMDAAMVLGEDDERFAPAPLLGTGGNDGRLDFTQNFMQRIVDLKLHENRPRLEACSLLQAGLWAQPVDGLGKASVGQFSPGRAGGPNATQGMEGAPADNPWDFLIGLEGSLMLASAAVRRLGAHSSGRASFPFTVRSRSVGSAASSDEETAGARELWMPLWKQAASAGEIKLLFSEGRADVGGRPAGDAVEFSRAVAGLGTDRGIHSFCRYGLFERSGRSFLAVAMQRFDVPVKRRKEVNLLLPLDKWLAEFRGGAGGDAAPQRLQAAARRVESKIFDYCRYGERADLCGVLTALGMAERELAVTGGQRGGKQICRPLQDIAGDWIQATNDESPEFEIALALASLHHRENQILPVRANLEPVNRKGKFWNWGEAGRSVVWKRGSLVENMIAVLERRLLDGGGNAGIDFHHGVRMETLADFIAGETDDRRIEELLWALMLVGASDRVSFKHPKPSHLFPRAYAMLKPLFLPRPIRFYEGKWRYHDELVQDAISIRSEPRILPLVRAGHIREACEIAARRLRVTDSKLKPLPSPAASGFMRQIDAEIKCTLDPTRLAASLLLPIQRDDLNRLLRLVTRLPENDASTH